MEISFSTFHTLTPFAPLHLPLSVFVSLPIHHSPCLFTSTFCLLLHLSCSLSPFSSVWFCLSLSCEVVNQTTPLPPEKDFEPWFVLLVTIVVWFRPQRRHGPTGRGTGDSHGKGTEVLAQRDVVEVRRRGERGEGSHGNGVGE